jgi:hypothetical protein
MALIVVAIVGMLGLAIQTSRPEIQTRTVRRRRAARQRARARAYGLSA